MIEALVKAIRDIPDYPKPGIVFKDITTVLQNPELFRTAVGLMTEPLEEFAPVDAVLAIEARGFIFGGAIAERLNAGFVPIRKAGKLPWKTRSVSYALEYGEDTLEMHMDGIGEGDRVVIVDDLLATGGTVEAAIKLAQAAGAEVVSTSFLIELEFLSGRNKLAPHPVNSVIKF